MKLSFSIISKPEYQSKPIYVLNKTRDRDRGPVFFNCPKLNGNGVDSVMVPDTFIPINVAEQMPWNRLIESIPFRQAVNRGLLQLIDEVEALEILSMEGAEQELERLNKVEGRYAEVTTTEGVDLDIVERPETDVLPEIIQNILGRYDEQGEISVLNSLRTQADSLSQKHLKEIFKWAKANGAESIMKFAKSLKK